MGTILAALHWQDRRNGPVSMMPYVDLDVAKHYLTTSTAYKTWLEKAMFPQYVPAYAVAHACKQVGLEIRRRHAKPRRGAMASPVRDAEVVWNNEIITVATLAQPDGFHRPYWQADLFGRTITSGSLDCLAVEIADAIKAGPQAVLASAFA